MLDIDFNGAIVVFCRVLGNVTLAKNNTVLSGCEVHGNITVLENNSELHGNSVGGEISNDGQGTVCDGNVAFDDANGDQVVQPEEVGDPIDC